VQTDIGPAMQHADIPSPQSAAVDLRSVAHYTG